MARSLCSALLFLLTEDSPSSSIFSSPRKIVIFPHSFHCSISSGKRQMMSERVWMVKCLCIPAAWIASAISRPRCTFIQKMSSVMKTLGAWICSSSRTTRAGDFSRKLFSWNFHTAPFDHDIYAQFGDDFALPVVGNFDPPVTGENPPQYEDVSFTNPVNPKDVNGDNIVSPADGLHIINVINAGGAGQLPVFRSEATPTGPFYDTNADGYITPQDVLVVFNQLNEDVLVGEGEGDGALILETNDVPSHATDRPEELARPVFVTSLRNAPTIERANDRATTVADGAQQDKVDAFFSQPQAQSLSRIDRPSVADGEQIDELLDALADDLGKQWWDDSSPFEL